jgi:hypothetical protein
MNQMPQQQESGAFLRFWTTIPGLLTAAAAVITAVGTIYIATLNKPSVPPTPPAPIAVTTVTAAPSTPPPAPASIAPADVNLTAFDPSTIRDAAAVSLLDECGSGSSSACADFVESMAAGCYDGDMLYCDVLFVVSPSASVYEEFGATCGYRLATTEFANQCSSL